MRSYLLAVVAAVVIPAVHLAAQQAPDAKPAVSETKWTRELVESPPSRELQFEETAESHFMELPRAHVKLLELKAMATVRFIIPQQSQPRSADLEPSIYGVVPDSWLRFLQPGQFHLPMPGPPGQKHITLGDVMQELIDSMPVEQRPSEEVTRYFTSDTIATRFLAEWEVERTLEGGQELQRRVQLLARSPEEARAVASGLVKIIDWSVSRPIQLHVLTQRPPRLEGVTKAKEKLEQLTRQLGVESDDVAGLGSFPDSTTKTHLRTLSVELIVERAGIQARLDACEKLLAGELSATQRARAEQQQLDAQIDLAAVETKRKTVQATFDLAGANSNLQRATALLRAVDDALEQFAPPQVEQPIKIQPIDWR